ncbi:hypothetical protein BDK51DRAFT_28089 [Blyttiomyces helicus]|uniref:Chitin-binding type-2 domain-containing protein n=1 Tax=Blyttiomyces helicus TaxID=388810 RepID=A0A4V1IRB9_9FUNG|nr:hypothetical protein BDK51DRAFT_28089 [Blyttiomyces helicus]|eukprot:RKO89517.1 hypothetical protein BDK51DRAFT_28089 [Blyttiomyces helicus]
MLPTTAILITLAFAASAAPSYYESSDSHKSADSCSLPTIRTPRRLRNANPPTFDANVKPSYDSYSQPTYSKYGSLVPAGYQAPSSGYSTPSEGCSAPSTNYGYQAPSSGYSPSYGTPSYGTPSYSSSDSCDSAFPYFHSTGSPTPIQCAKIACAPGQTFEYVQRALHQCHALETQAKTTNGGYLPSGW